MKKDHLNKELSDYADCILTLDDLDWIAEAHGLAVSAVAQIVKGRKKCKPEVVDTIQKFTKARLKSAFEKL